MGLTTDPKHPDLQRGPPGGETEPRMQNKTYLVLSAEEIAKGFLKPLRRAYRHTTCGSETTMGYELSATYARDPWFYGLTYCTRCCLHRPLEEFVWLPDGESMDPSMWTAEEVNRVVAVRAALEKP